MEILSNKLLATAFEASLGCMTVTAYAKRRQQGNRDSYRAPKSINQSADFVVWKEGKTRVYRNGEISRGSAVLEGTIHVIQGLYVNCGRTCIFLPECVKGKVCPTTKRRKAKEMQVVGGPKSTDEGMNKINAGGKSRENCSSQFWPAKLYQRGNISYTQR